MNNQIIKIFVLLLFVTFSLKSNADDLNSKIKQKTAQIDKNASNPTLHYQRGALYQEKGDYKRAIKDYLIVKGYYSKDVSFSIRLMESYIGAKKFYEAIEISERMIKKFPNNKTLQELHATIKKEL